MRCKANCGGLLSPTRQFKRILVPHASGDKRVTWVTLDGSVKGYPIVEEDLCSKCLASSSNYSGDYEYFNSVDESLEEEIDLYDLGLDLPELNFNDNY